MHPFSRHGKALGVGVVLATVALLLASGVPALFYGNATFQAGYVRSAAGQGDTDGWLFLKINNTGLVRGHYLLIVTPIGAGENRGPGQPITVMPGSSFAFSIGVKSDVTHTAHFQVSVYKGSAPSPSALVFSKLVEVA